jgi:hypothetical protein
MISCVKMYGKAMKAMRAIEFIAKAVKPKN